MPRVNLVPAEEKRKEFRRQFYIIPVAGAIVIVAAFAGSYYYFNSQLDSKEQDLALYRQNNANLAEQVAELKRYEDLKNEKQARLSAVTTAYEARFRWSRMLDDMSFVVPETVSLTKIEGKVPGAVTAGAESGRQAGDQRDLTFEGYTDSMPEVAIFMVRLALIPTLTDVSLRLAEVEELGGELPVHFIINASLKTVGETQRPAVAPTTGEEGPSQVTPTTGTTTSPTTRTSTTGTGTATTGTSTNR